MKHLKMIDLKMINGGSVFVDDFYTYDMILVLMGVGPILGNRYGI